jgi:membrane protease YdiL (CAAX protease family)
MDREHAFKRIGTGMAAGYLAFMFLSNICSPVLSQILPDKNLAFFLGMLLSLGSILLVTWLIVRRVPAGGTPTGDPFTARSFWCIFFASAVCAYLLGTMSTELQNMIQNFTGKADKSVFQSILNTDAPVGMFFSMILVAPVMEELIFRKVLFERLRPYGNGFAVIATAVLFGLYHGNLEQIPYAVLAGLFLGTIMAITGDIRITMMFHFVNNLISALPIVSLNLCGGMIGGGINHFLSVAPPVIGFIILIVHIIRNHGTVSVPKFLTETDSTLLKELFRTRGMIAYIVLVCILVVFMFAVTTFMH